MGFYPESTVMFKMNNIGMIKPVMWFNGVTVLKKSGEETLNHGPVKLNKQANGL